MPYGFFISANLSGLIPRPTTRRGRFLWDRSKYRERERRYYSSKWKWEQRPNHWQHKGPRAGPINTNVKQQVPYKSARTYDAEPLVPPFTYSWTLQPGRGPFRPPHVHLNQGLGWPVFKPRPDYHFATSTIWYHIRAVNVWKKRPRNAFWTARRRKINGANWYYFRNAVFPAWDVLGRTPNEDERPGPPEPTRLSGWPVDLRLND